jgi:HAD superfamily hydrolase (TIGR01549 family)
MEIATCFTEVIMKYDAIIFDVGDTLLENYPNQKQIYADRIKQLGFAVDEEMAEHILKATTNSAYRQIEKEQNGAPRMTDEDFDSMLDEAALTCVDTNYTGSTFERLRLIPIPKQELRIIPGVVDVLHTLSAKGYRLGIVSNHRVWLMDYLSEIGLSGFFETIVVSDVVSVEKPDVRIMEIALERLNVKAKSCLYVGDHPFDVLCAKNAGMACAWISQPESVLPDSIPFQEDYRIQSLHELLTLL